MFIQGRIQKSERATGNSKLQQQHAVETAQNTCNIETGSTVQVSGILRQTASTFIFMKIWSLQLGSPRHQAPLSIHRTSKKLVLLRLC